MRIEFRISHIEENMIAKNRSLLVLSCLSVGLAFGPSLSGVAAQPGDSFKIRSEVDLVTVEVTVLDKKGNPVHNLKKEDFQLYEDGKKQEILSIDEVNAASEASPSGVNPIAGTTSHRGKTVLIFFANNLIKSEDIKMSCDSAEKFVREHMRPQDLFAVAFSWKIIQNFTSDRNDVLEAIRQAAGVNLSGTRSRGTDFYMDDLWRFLDGVNYSLAQIKGQKSILMYAETVSTLPTSRHDHDLLPDLNAQAYSVPAKMDDWKLPIKSNVVVYTAEPGTPNAELDNLDQKMSNYYILGFRPSNPKHDGAIRMLQVKTKLNGLALKYQAGYQDRHPVDALANTKQETTLITALASPGTATQLPIVFRAAYFYDSSRTAKVLVESRIRLEKAAFRKKDAQVGMDFSIMCMAYGEDGSIAGRFSETLPVSVEKEKEAEFRKRDLAYRNYLRLRPGKYRVKLAVSDESGNLGSTERLLEIPILPERGLSSSSLLIAEQASRMPDLIGNIQSQMLDEDNPLLYEGFEIEPSVDNRFPANASLPVVFRLYNLPGMPDQGNLTVKIRIIDEKGKEYSVDPIPLKNKMSPAGNAEAAVALSLLFKEVPPGRYRLIIETGEATETATLETDLELTAPIYR